MVYEDGCAEGVGGRGEEPCGGAEAYLDEGNNLIRAHQRLAWGANQEVGRVQKPSGSVGGDDEGGDGQGEGGEDHAHPSMVYPGGEMDTMKW